MLKGNSNFISLLSLVIYFCAVIVVVLLLMSRVTLIKITDQAVKLEHELSELEEINERLLLDYETAFNMTEIEKCAINELGMQRPSEDQFYYIENTAPDKAVILNVEEKESFGAKIISFLSYLGE